MALTTNSFYSVPRDLCEVSKYMHIGSTDGEMGIDETHLISVSPGDAEDEILDVAQGGADGGAGLSRTEPSVDLELTLPVVLFFLSAEIQNQVLEVLGLAIDVKDMLVKDLAVIKSPKEWSPRSSIAAAKYQVKPPHFAMAKGSSTRRIHQPR